jgi:hypothetical protein
VNIIISTNRATLAPSLCLGEGMEKHSMEGWPPQRKTDFKPELDFPPPLPDARKAHLSCQNLRN